MVDRFTEAWAERGTGYYDLYEMEYEDRDVKDSKM